MVIGDLVLRPFAGVVEQVARHFLEVALLAAEPRQRRHPARLKVTSRSGLSFSITRASRSMTMVGSALRPTIAVRAAMRALSR